MGWGRSGRREGEVVVCCGAGGGGGGGFDGCVGRTFCETKGLVLVQFQSVDGEEDWDVAGAASERAAGATWQSSADLKGKLRSSLEQEEDATEVRRQGRAGSSGLKLAPEDANFPGASKAEDRPITQYRSEAAGVGVVWGEDN